MNSADAFSEHLAVVTASLATLPAQVDAAAALVAQALRGGAKVLICGNGGSAADAQHFAAELVGRFEADRPGLAAIALTTDSSALTAIANDHGYELVFARQVQALARPGDVLVAIRTSGGSPSVLRAAEAARDLGCVVIGMTGTDGGALAARSDLLLAVPSSRVARVQEAHELCLHAMAGQIEAALSPVEGR